MGRALIDNPSYGTLKMREWREKNKEHSKAYKREWGRKRRIQVINHYGGACICCGETQWQFLALDHKDGGGNQHRKEVKARGNTMIDWAINNDYPDIFQVLCHNCNQARGFYGACPHED